MRMTEGMGGVGGGSASRLAVAAARRHVQEAQERRAAAVEEGREQGEERAIEDDEEGDAPAPSSSPPSSASAAAAGISGAVLSGYVGNFYRVIEGVTGVLADLEHVLPQIVVVGQESSGKSSVLESLAMMPLFPRKEDICTRLPIHLKMRHVPQCDVVDGDPELMPHRGGPLQDSLAKHQIKMKLIYSDGRDPVVSNKEFTPAEAAELMSEWMEGIVKEENEEKKLKGVVDHVLEIEVRSPLVPNLNLVDLPGIVAGRLIDEPDDMMQRTRALVEKYLKMPHTLVLAVVPAFERVRNSQAFQLVQQYNLMDSAIGVLTMVDRSLDTSNPGGPLAEVMGRLDGTSRDIVYLKQGYVAVKNRDTRMSPEWSLDAFKSEENAWLKENLPGYVERNLASSSVLALKLEQMLADHVRASWVPQTLAKIQSERVTVEEKLAALGPGSQEIVNSILSDNKPASGRKRIFELIKPIFPRLLEGIDDEMLQLTALIHADFLQSREEHELMLIPFESKSNAPFGKISGSLLTASLLILDSQRMYLSEHLGRILKNVALHIVSLIQKIIAKSNEAGKTPQRLERFANLHCFFASVLWERLNELLIDEEDLLVRLEKSFLEYDPENADVLQLSRWTKKPSSKMTTALKALASSVELYLDSKGFQNTSLDELYLRPMESLEASQIATSASGWKEGSLNRDVARLIISAKVPTPSTQPCKPKTPRRTKASAKVSTPTCDGFNFPSAQSPSPATPPPRAFGFGAPPPTSAFFAQRAKTQQNSAFSFGASQPSAPSIAAVPSAAVKPNETTAEKDEGEFQDVGEFEARLSFAFTTHLVTPLLQSVCDLAGIERKLKAYVSLHPQVAASRMHLFHENTSEERKKLATLAKRLDTASVGLQSMQNYS